MTKTQKLILRLEAPEKMSKSLVRYRLICINDADNSTQSSLRRLTKYTIDLVKTGNVTCKVKALYYYYSDYSNVTRYSGCSEWISSNTVRIADTRMSIKSNAVYAFVVKQPFRV